AFGHRSGQVHQLVKALTPQAGDKPAWMSNHGMSTCSSVVLGIGTWAHQPWPAARQAWPAVDPTPRQVRRTYHRRLPRCGGAPTQESPDIPEAELQVFRQEWPDNRSALVVEFREMIGTIRDVVRITGSLSAFDPSLTRPRRCFDAGRRLRTHYAIA